MPDIFNKIKERVLGKRYDLSVAFLPPTAMQKAMKYKKKSTLKKETIASNVLAFPLSKTSGEILICKSTANKQAKNYQMDKQTFVTYLFIHGLLHLKGFTHSATMESEERRIMKRFGLRCNE